MKNPLYRSKSYFQVKIWQKFTKKRSATQAHCVSGLILKILLSRWIPWHVIMKFLFPFPKMQLHTWNLLPYFKLPFKAHPSQAVKYIHPSLILSISMYRIYTSIILVYREQDGYIIMVCILIRKNNTNHVSIMYHRRRYQPYTNIRLVGTWNNTSFIPVLYQFQYWVYTYLILGKISLIGWAHA
jgi:hypothetical protein